MGADVVLNSAEQDVVSEVDASRPAAPTARRQRRGAQ